MKKNNTTSKYVFDLDRFSFDKYKLGYSPPKKSGGEGIINYESGYNVCVDKKRVSSVSIYFSKDYGCYDEYKGVVVFNKKRHQFNMDTSFEDIVTIFGKPQEHWNDGVEMCAIYSYSDEFIEIIWRVDGVQKFGYISMEIN